MPTDNKNRIFNYSLTKRIEDQYGRDLYNVSNEVDNIVSEFIRRIDNLDDIQIEDVNDLINSLVNYSERITDWAERTASRVVNNIESQDLKQWDKHSKNMSKLMKKELSSKDMKKILDVYKKENAKLITSLPINAANRVQEIVYNGVKEGKRASSLIDSILRTGKVTKSRANLIARTETSKAITGLLMARSSSIGLNWLVWHSSGGQGGDGRTRFAHRKMDGVLMTWDDPPNPEKLFPEPKVKSYGNYLPGSTFNCRCWAAPLIHIEDVSWPAKVYMKGKIRLMNRKEFEKIANQEFLKAA